MPIPEFIAFKECSRSMLSIEIAHTTIAVTDATHIVVAIVTVAELAINDAAS